MKNWFLIDFVYIAYSIHRAVALEATTSNPTRLIRNEASTTEDQSAPSRSDVSPSAKT